MDGAASLANQNPMLGCQLIGKSILNCVTKQAATNLNGLSPTSSGSSAAAAAAAAKSNSTPNRTSKTTVTTNNRAKNTQQQQKLPTSMCETKSQSKEANNNNHDTNEAGKKVASKCATILCQTQEVQSKTIEHDPHEVSLSSVADQSAHTNQQHPKIDPKDLELIFREAQDLKIKTRKLQLEVDEKNEIISVLKDELEASKEISDKYQKENIQLLKDSKRVKFLQDENDFLQDKVGNVDKLELEIKRLKEKLNELDFLKLRITELEEDCSKAQEDSLLHEKKCQTAEAKLSQIAKLDAELNKWKSFSNELESERNSLQSKLLESIEQETKLNLVNKKVEDEVRRLKSLVKFYEEQQAEEQASNSLIMSNADLKQFDQSCASISQQHDHGDQDNQLNSPAADTSIKFELDQQYEKELNEENRSLKQKLNEHEVKFNSLVETNQKIRSELEGSKALIADLRQDLACEKSLAHKLTSQLNNFSKQMKNLDKQYFPMYVSSLQQSNLQASKHTEALKPSPKGSAAEISKTTLPTRGIACSSTKSRDVESLPNQSPPITGQNLPTTEGLARVDLRSLSPTQTGHKVPPVSAIRGGKKNFEQDGERSQDQHQLSTANINAKSGPTSSALVEPASCSSPSSSTSPLALLAGVNSPNRSKPGDIATSATNLMVESRRQKLNTTDERDNGKSDDQVPSSKRAAQAPIKLSRSTATSNFVRNSLPSRSVNLGHLKSSAYLDRIRASVTATTTTNTSSSFNEQTRNIVMSQQSANQMPDSRYTLNCMLGHQHSERCFASDGIDHLQASQAAATGHYNHHGHHHHLHNSLNSHLPIQPSRQLNALIDPVSHERLMVSILQQQNHVSVQRQHQHQQLHNQTQERGSMGLHEKTELSEQQVAQLARIHHQHYYHHLQHMHQLHQLHHQHHLHLQHRHLHHKYQQQHQTLVETNETEHKQHQHQPDCRQLDPGSNFNKHKQVQSDLIYSGGSQFYAPSAQSEQVHANTTTTNDNNITQSDEYCHRTKLVKSNDRINQYGLNESSSNQMIARTGSVAKMGGIMQQQQQQVNHNHLLNHYTLPQIDEVNGLPSVETANNVHHLNESPRMHLSKVTSEALTKASQSQNLTSNGSPSTSSSSPTSSASSNLSPSSASSSSSINSLSTSSAPIRHIATDGNNRRQFSVERELVSVMPMTAALSRVGSCRSSNRPMPPDGSRRAANDRQDVALMQTPAKSQQPSMRTSKILNISQQSGAQLTQVQQQQSQLTGRRTKGLGNLKQEVDKSVSDFNNIKFSHNLAFASLRAPKCYPSESGVGSSLISNNGKGHNPGTGVKRSTTSSSLERRKQGNNEATNDDSGNKSSVWFEYGCV